MIKLEGKVSELLKNLPKSITFYSLTHQSTEKFLRALQDVTSGRKRYVSSVLESKFGKVRQPVSDMKFPKPRRARKRKHKYSGTRVQGITSSKSYPSMIERDYAEYLKIRERVGEITDIEEQPSVTLAGGIRYKADFASVDKATDKQIFVDTKGLLSDRFRLIMKLWKVSGPAPLHVVMRDGSKDMRFYVHREIIPGAR